LSTTSSPSSGAPAARGILDPKAPADGRGDPGGAELGRDEALMIQEVIQRTLDRLQTGLRPTHEEIDQLIGLPVGETSGASIEDGFLRLQLGDDDRGRGVMGGAGSELDTHRRRILLVL
jgi:hypothetical protein